MKKSTRTPSGHNDTRRPLTKADIDAIPRKRRIAIAESAAPWLFKPPKLRKRIRLAVGKAGKKGQAIANELDILITLVDTLYDLDQQATAHNPHLLERQRNGAIRKEFDAQLEKLLEQWKKLYMLA